MAKTPVKVGDLIIVNDYDCPCVQLVAQVRKIENGRCFADYVTTGTLSTKKAENPVENATLVSDFGVRLVNNNGILEAYTLREPSRATYKNGKPRNWQGRSGDGQSLRQQFRTLVVEGK